MAQYTVPQFIEREPKIVGPFTFKQAIYVGIAGAICFILYFSVSFFYFLLTTIILMSISFALSFLKIEGRPLPTILKSVFSFSIKPKIYFWHKKNLPPKIIKKVEKKEKKESPSSLKLVEKSRLKELTTKIELK